MRPIPMLWLILAALYCGFLIWHTPLRPPLSAQERTEFLAKLEAGADPSSAAQESLAFLEADDGGPFYMLNLIAYREKAQYTPGFESDITSAQIANETYSSYVIPLLLARGSYPLIVSERLATVIDTLGPSRNFETVALIRYRSRRDFLDMITSDAFTAAVPHKWASVSGTLVAPTELIGVLNLTLIVPLTLLGIGGLASLIRIPRSTPRPG